MRNDFLCRGSASLTPSPLYSGERGPEWTIHRRAALLIAWLIISCFGASASFGDPPASQPTVDPALWKRLTDIDQRASQIASMAADFEQRKFTALLRKPLVSSGKVLIKGSAMRWDTEKPQKTVMFVSANDVQLYYPAQKMEEQYTLDQRLAELAASPLPRLAILKDRFSFAQIPVVEMDKEADASKFLALKLTPAVEDLRQHLHDVKVLLDVERGYIVQAELTDPDGDRTVIRFTNVGVNAEVGDLALKVPPGTKITRPLEGVPAPSSNRSK